MYDHIKIAEKTYKYTGKTGRYMELARRLANQSIFPEYKHGAVLVKGGTVRNGSFNKSNYCSFGHRFRKKEYGIPTLHAEIGTVLGLDRTVTEGATVYVARVGKGNDFKMSKPCPMCREALKHCGVKRVVYTIDDKTAGSYRL